MPDETPEVSPRDFLEAALKSIPDVVIDGEPANIGFASGHPDAYEQFTLISDPAKFHDVTSAVRGTVSKILHEIVSRKIKSYHTARWFEDDSILFDCQGFKFSARVNADGYIEITIGVDPDAID